jgi:uncharacterized membrane protein YhdT
MINCILDCNECDYMDGGTGGILDLHYYYEMLCEIGPKFQVLMSHAQVKYSLSCKLKAQQCNDQ